ncbi:PREDICTED: uncharacterized protein LOC108973857 [Bactrocera latifrons]|uniref:uncharacterized protein LOC108973857 n=1 Tax=Bactrocera latifrons TaxID=174628 RepID=UPI0008DE1658|nr:PREDICTED: uncharacterized protein LOC108973857 [Bactrocera latifrons]
MPFDVEMIVVKTYSHFYLFTVRVVKLKKFCESVEVKYKKLIGYSKTRFIGLLSSVDSILRIFDGLKEYFLGGPNTPNSLLLFFEDPRAKMWLISFVIKHLFSTEQLKQWKATILMQWKLCMHSILLYNRSNLGKKKHFCPLQCKRKWNIFLLLMKECQKKRCKVSHVNSIVRMLI